jgi:aspartyl-tRNA(Asn)/glutamyl-tRNA(Gln) amidotransferase subunit A
MIAFASSLDQAGIFAKNTEDNAIVLEIISGYDKKDSTSKQIDNFKYQKQDVRGLKIGIPKECYIDGLNSEIIQLWEKSAKKLQDLGGEIIDISLPNIKYSLPVYYIICSAEVASNLARYDGIRYGSNPNIKSSNIDEMYEKYRCTSFGDEVKRRILMGTYVLSSGYYDEYYEQAKRVQNLIMNDYFEAFKKVDVILNPTAPSEAFAINSNPSPLEMYMNDIFTVPTSIARLPCMSVPAGLSSNKLPLGMHLTANYFEENKLYNVALAFESN